MPKQYFITGTNTDIGKTFVTAGLTKLSTSLNIPTAVMKPVQTGTEEYHSDLSYIKSQAPEIMVLEKELECPYEFKFAASPHLAAAKEDKSIDPQVILNAHNEITNLGAETILVEGAGGIFVPIVGSYTMLDLMKDLDIPVILVGTVELGAINHALLSIEALKSAGLEIAGIILNKVPQEPSQIELDNIETIEKLSNVPLLGTIKSIDPDNEMDKALLEQFNTPKFKKLFN